MDIKPDSFINLKQGDTLPESKNLPPVPKKYVDELEILINKINVESGSIYLSLKRLYAFLERFNKSHVSKFVSCKKGCSHCCHIDIQLTPLEAEYIMLATNLQAFKGTKTTGHTSACPFLSEKRLCKIYNYRPLLCRTYHVTSDPVLCGDSNSLVIEYGGHRSNMGNFIYLTVAKWLYFQNQHSDGELIICDIRDFFPQDHEDIQNFLSLNPPKQPC